MGGSETKHLGIVLDIDSSGVIRGARLADEALDRTKKKAQQTGQSVSDVGGQTQKSLQKMATQMTTVGLPMMMAANKGIEQLKESVKAAGTLEQALGQVRVALGMVGKKARDPTLMKEYQAIRKEILRIGKDTEFSTSQAAAGFYMLKSAGLTAMEAKDIMAYTMSLSSASQGVLDLGQSAKITGLIMNKFTEEQLGPGGARAAMDAMGRLTTETDVQFQDLQIILSSMGAAASKFKKTTFTDFMAIAGVMKTMGLSAAQAGQYMFGFTRSIDQVLMNFSRMEKGLLKKQAKWRMKQILAMGITKKDFVDAAGNYRNMIDVMARIEGKLKGISPAKRGEILKLLFGADMPAQMLNLAKAYRAKTGKSLKMVSDTLKESKGFLGDAQKDFLTGWTGLVQIYKGTTDLFKGMIGKALLPVLKPVVKWLTELINKFVAWGDKHPVLFKAIVGLVVALVVFSKIASTIMLAMAGMSVIMMGMGGAAGVAATGTVSLSVAFKTLWASMAPVLLILLKIAVVIGIVIALGYLIGQVLIHWGEIVDWVKAKLLAAMAAIGEFFDTIATIFTETWEGIKQFFTDLVNWFYEGGKNIINAIIDGIKDAAIALWETVKDIVGGIRDFLPFSPAKVGPLMDIDQSGMNFLKMFQQGIENQAPFTMETVHRTMGEVKGAMEDEYYTPVVGPMGAAPMIGGEKGDVNINIAAMNFYATRLSAHEVEIFSEQMMRKVGERLREYRARSGG